MMFYDDGFDKEVEEKLVEYEKIFPNGFPLMEFEGNKKQLIKTINKCIKKHKEYYVEYEDDADY
ncbi:MAG: hypothetical protein HFJ34_04830 [Clostridia bacterium]|nr:hypothetical protein [Clostridia bacterium]